MLVNDKLKNSAREANNELMLEAVSKIATSTINKLATDNSEILYAPSNVEELENNTSMLSNVVALKIKNTLIKN